MGLTSGNRGVKQWLRNNAPEAFLECDRLCDLVSHANAHDGGIGSLNVVIVDFNIVMMAVPGSVKTMEEYVEFTIGQLRTFAAAGQMVVLCFDDPAKVPLAKVEEQAARDAQVRRRAEKQPKKSSAWIDRLSNGEDLSIREMEEAGDCHLIMERRRHRYRFVDEVMRRVWSEAKEWQPNELKTAVVMCGVDMAPQERDRPAPRQPGIHGNDERLLAWVGESEWNHPGMGEADVRLGVVDGAVRRNGGDEIKLLVWVSVDTDQIPIGMAASRRAEASASNARTLLAMRQRVSFSPDGSGSSPLLCVCLRTLQRSVPMLHKGEYALPLTFVAASMAIGGCDFIPSMVHFDMVAEKWTRVAQEEARLRQGEEAGEEATSRRMLKRLIGLLCAEAEHRPRFSKQAKLTAQANAVALRAEWTSMYWSDHAVARRAALDAPLSEWGFSPPPPPPQPICTALSGTGKRKTPSSE